MKIRHKVKLLVIFLFTGVSTFAQDTDQQEIRMGPEWRLGLIIAAAFVFLVYLIYLIVYSKKEVPEDTEESVQEMYNVPGMPGSGFREYKKEHQDA